MKLTPILHVNAQCWLLGTIANHQARPLTIEELESHLKEVEETKLKLTSAEARVKELEGLEIDLTKHPVTEDYVLVTVRVKRDAHKACKFNLGDAIPRKDAAPSTDNK